MTEILSISVSLFAGLLMTRVLKKTKLPDVTAYLLAGILIGPCILGKLGIAGLGFIDYESISVLGFVSDIALGFIAFSIGNEFRLSQLRETGKQALVIGIAQAVCATVLVDIVLIVLHFLFPEWLSVPAAITLGAIASATAPASTLMVVRQYKAKGPLTDLLLPIVALDDAVGLILFAVSFGVAKALTSGVIDVYTVVLNPLIEIIASIILGAVAGYVLSKLEQIFFSNTNRLSMTIGFVFLTVALSMIEIEVGNVTVGFSPLLVCMMLGSVFCNMCILSDEIMKFADRWNAPVLVLFFVLAGAQLKLSVFTEATTVAIGVVYLISRSSGKYFGAKYSAKAVNCSKGVTNYLGITLLPQEGVALGMSTVAATLPGDGTLIKNIILFSVLIYELIGPLMTKWALKKAGEIVPKSKDVLERRDNKIKEITNS